ncbi:metallophosphoesterase [Streptomyces oryzae]|uniref:Metallophosphoesterase n=1 Tax=Streptomyces oryzae TaxID=1434886 RepID=A0ABS3XF50_9ACTN|nr:metallophosphoesterase [Streptomyces oryzae]MBO8194009.1 metallophosphoesterase [Streptomyces oryzae]
MVVVFVLIGLVVLGLLAGTHVYLWRRFVRDVSAPRSWWRRLGTVLAVVLPVTTFGALVSGRAGAPFPLQQVLAWPGFLWLACLLYLTLALLAGELVRFVLRRTAWGRERAARHRTAEPEPGPAAEEPVPVPESVPESASVGAETAGGSGGVATEATTGSAAGSAAGPAAGPAAGSRGAPSPAGPHTVPLSASVPTRRVFLARTLAGTAAVAGLGTTAAGAYSVLNGPTLKHITVPLAKLGRRTHGYRVAVVSDIHLGPILGRAHTQRIVDTINKAQPDLVTIVGDLVDGSVADLGPAAEPLRGLRSRHGSFFVTGNHEYFGNAREWIDHLRELDVHPLENARRELPGFDLAGVNDLAGEDQGEGPDYDRALRDRDTSRACVLMAHQPVQIHEAVDHDVDLQLSGHTHGGQMWPGNLLAALANPTVAGLERYGDTQLYVTRGAGAWGPPVRVGADSDITIVELAAKRA